MNEVETINIYESIRKRAASVGITVKTDTLQKFTIADVPKANGLICMDTIKDLDNFVYGYELGYKSGL